MPRALGIAAVAVAAASAAAAPWLLYEREKSALTDSAGRLCAARAHSLMVRDVASRCPTQAELSRRLGPAPIRVRRRGVGAGRHGEGLYLGYLCRDGKCVVIPIGADGWVAGKPRVADFVREGGA